MSEFESDTSALRAGQEVGRYRLLERIGQGGMGEVWLAQDTRMRRRVAIKAIRGEVSGDPRVRMRFVREAENAPQVVHPYVATVFDVVDRPEGPLLVMEYVEGRGLDAVIREGNLTPRRVARYGAQIAEALEAIHAHGLVHRDLKPSNVMITAQDHVKVMDLGIAARQPSQSEPDADTDTSELRLTREGGVVGTVAYMAPEQLRGAAPNYSGDLFSLGVVLWEALTAHHPFATTSSVETASAILNRPPGPHRDRRTLAASGALGAVVLGLLEKDPTERIPSAADAAARLRECFEGAPGRAVAGRTGPRRRASLAAGASGLAMLALFLGGGTGTPGPVRAVAAPAVAYRPAVAVLPFEDGTGGQLAVEGRVLADLLATTLSESSRVRGVPSQRVMDALRGGPQGEQAVTRIQRSVSPEWIVIGTLTEDRGDLVATVRLLDGQRPDQAIEFRERGPRLALLADRVTTRLVEDSRAPMLAGFVSTGPAPRASRDDEAQRLLLRAREAAREGRYVIALGNLESALQRDPAFVEATVLKANLLHTSGYDGAARETIRHALRLLQERTAPPGGREVQVARALEDRIFRPGRVSGSLESLSATYPDEPDSRIELSRSYTDAGEWDAALLEADAAVALDTLDPRARLVRAQALIGAERYEDAATALAEAVRLAETFDMEVLRARALEASAYLHYRTGRPETAQELYGMARQLYAAAGLDVLALSTRQSQADMELDLWDVTRAEAIYRETLPSLRDAGHYRRVVTTLGGLGLALLREGAIADAEIVLSEGVEEARKLDNPAILRIPLFNLAALWFGEGRLAEAEAAAREILAIDLQLDDAQRARNARNLLALIARQDGRLDEATVLLRELVVDSANARDDARRRSYTLSLLADVREQAEDPAGALEAASRALTLIDGDESSRPLVFRLCLRARSLARLARTAEAMSDLLRAERIAADVGVTPEMNAAVRQTRATLAMIREDWNGALRDAAPIEGGIPFQERPLGILRARALYRLGKPGDAAALARDERDHPATSEAERVIAGLVLAGSLAALGDREAAADEATACHRAAETIGLPLSSARAGALLAELSPANEAGPWLALAGRDLARYLDAIPADRRDAVRTTWEVRSIEQALVSLAPEGSE